MPRGGRSTVGSSVEPTGAAAGSRGVAQLLTDERGGVTVVLDGHPQSYVDLADPGLLVFEYVQHLALVIDALPAGRVAVTHVGGAGLTLARYVEHTRPGSPQIVLEPDAALTELVRGALPLPRGHRIRVRPEGGAQGIARLRDGSAEVVIVDAYAEGRVPADLVTPGFLAEVSRVLTPVGVLLMNLADEPGLHWVARVAATVQPLLPSMNLLAATDVLKAKRYGNAVLVASRESLDGLDLARRVARTTFPTRLRDQAAVRRMASATTPLDDRGGRSPAPPDPGRWRLR